MNVEAFTYVHDGTVPFSIENAKTICKQYKIKHHILSLPKHEHLKSFISYFEAWIANPTTISAGMTCVACKHLHILGSELAKNRGIPMIVWGNSPLEYSPFLAMKVKVDTTEQFKREGVLKSSLSLLKEAISSPKFSIALLKHLKTSFYGCIAVTPLSGFLKKKYKKINPIMFYEFEKWDPVKIKNYLESNTDWNIPNVIEEDWHSDCIFNIFKEYMFQKMIGVTYTDAHLSNQIRYKYITREEALFQLKNSKKYYSKALPEALKFIGVEHLSEKIDLSCFE
jgi:hypothetical protein